jgi:hypothetical protein
LATSFGSTFGQAAKEHYVIYVPVGTASPSRAGWVFSALFKVAAGLNVEKTDVNLTLDLSFIGNKKAMLITDGATKREFAQSEINNDKATAASIKSTGGFVAVFK